jgi:hypothetical protein
MVVIILHPHHLGKNYLKNIRESIWIDTFDGAKPRFLNRGKKRRSVSTLSIPRALVLSAVEGSDRGVEWVDLENQWRMFEGRRVKKGKRKRILAIT